MVWLEDDDIVRAVLPCHRMRKTVFIYKAAVPEHEVKDDVVCDRPGVECGNAVGIFRRGKADTVIIGNLKILRHACCTLCRSDDCSSVGRGFINAAGFRHDVIRERCVRCGLICVFACERKRTDITIAGFLGRHVGQTVAAKDVGISDDFLKCVLIMPGIQFGAVKALRELDHVARLSAWWIDVVQETLGGEVDGVFDFFSADGVDCAGN